MASPRASAPSRSSSPSPRSPSASPRSFSRASSPSPRTASPSPRATTRRTATPAVRSAVASSRGQGVLRGGQASVSREPSGGLRRGASAAPTGRSGAPAARGTGTGTRRSAPLDFDGPKPATRASTPGFRRGGDGLLGDVSDRLHGRTGPGSGGGKGPGSGGGGKGPGSGGAGAGTWGGGHHHVHDHGFGDCRYDHHHRWYDDHHWGLTFSFGIGYGPYYGVSYYHPYHSYVVGRDYAFFYPAPVTFAYVPYGFYTETTPVYVTRYEVIRETVPAAVYETSEGPPAPPPEDAEVRIADPAPAAGSPATEKFLREASDHFRKKEYYEAAVKFRLAALSSPELPGPLFALGQSLVAMEQDSYAAKVLRRAIEMSPKMLEETGDISGVWESPQEFDRVMASLEARSAASPVDGDARFLLAAERYFAGDVRCREALDLLQEARPMDAAVAHLRAGAAARFKSPEELPAIEKK